MGDFGKMLVVFGAILIAAGVVVILLGKANIPVGRLPGDVVYRGKNTTVYFPIVTSIVLSVLLSLVFWAVARFRR